MHHGPSVRQFVGGQWLLGARQQRLQGVMRHCVNVLVCGARLHCHGQKLLIAPRGPLDDRNFEREQRSVACSRRVGSRPFHASRINSNVRANPKTCDVQEANQRGFTIWSAQSMLQVMVTCVQTMRLERRNRRGRCHAVPVCVAAGLLFGWSVVAQQQKPNLMVDYVPPSLLSTNAEAYVVKLAIVPADSTHDTAAVASSRSTPQRRWQEFEAEFGIQEKDHSFLRGSLQTAKYKLDETVFAAQEFIENLHYETTLKDLMGDSSIGGGGSHHSSSDSASSWLETTKFRSGVDWNWNTGRPFVGMQLEMKFGD